MTLTRKKIKKRQGLIPVGSEPLGTTILSIHQSRSDIISDESGRPAVGTVPVAYHLCLGEVGISISWFLYPKNGHKSHISQSDREDQVRYHLWKHLAQ